MFCAQVREIHTRSSALRVSSLNVPNSSSTLSGLCSISQSIRTHLLGLRGGNQSSRTRPISVSCALPFGVSSLISASKESERLQASSGLHFTPTGSVDGHVVVQIKAASVPESQSGYLRTTIDIAHSVQSCSSQEALKEHSYRSVSETMVSKIDESRNSVQKNTVGLSLLLWGCIFASCWFQGYKHQNLRTKVFSSSAPLNEFGMFSTMSLIVVVQCFKYRFELSTWNIAVLLSSLEWTNFKVWRLGMLYSLLLDSWGVDRHPCGFVYR